MQDLSQMTTAELKKYLSQHRNDSTFHDGLKVLMERSDGAHRHPSLLTMPDPEATFGALLKEQLDRLGE
jgi:hypothetical protein